MSKPSTAAPPETGTAHVQDVGDAGYHKGLKNRHIQMIAIGGAIGTGLFLGSGNRFEIAGPGLAIVYAVCGIFAFIVVRALGELALYRPSSGAFVSYAREFFGEKGAYTVGWLYFLDWAATLVADITAVAVYTHFWSFFLPVPQWLIALVALAVVLTMNLISVKLFGEMEFWFAFIKVGAIVLFGVIGIWALVTQHPIDGHTPGISLIADNGGLIPNGLGSLFAITLGVVFAFAGIEMVGITAGESDNPQQAIPKAVNSVVWRILLFYVGSVMLLALLQPWTSYSGTESPFVTVLNNMGIPGGADIMNIVVMTAALSSLNAGLYATGRTLRSLAMAGTAPRFAKRMNRSGIPYGGILITSLVGVPGVILNVVMPEDAFALMLNISGIGTVAAWSSIMLSHWAFVRKARLGEVDRPRFQLPFAPVLNVLTLGFLALVVVLIGFDGEIGRLTLVLTGIIGAFLMLGWFGVRKRINAAALTEAMDVVGSIAALDDPAKGDDSRSRSR
ncbi:amino acid permease [Leucobacter zeae]|nr:amino acid permease [Leucobacter zeae]